MSAELTDDDRRDLGTAVAALRRGLGLSKEAAARQAGISSITWKRVEDGLRVQDAKLTQALKVLPAKDVILNGSKWHISDGVLMYAGPELQEDIDRREQIDRGHLLHLIDQVRSEIAELRERLSESEAEYNRLLRALNEASQMSLDDYAGEGEPRLVTDEDAGQLTPQQQPQSAGDQRP